MVTESESSVHRDNSSNITGSLRVSVRKRVINSDSKPAKVMMSSACNVCSDTKSTRCNGNCNREKLSENTNVSGMHDQLPRRRLRRDKRQYDGSYAVVRTDSNWSALSETLHSNKDAYLVMIQLWHIYEEKVYLTNHHEELNRVHIGDIDGGVLRSMPYQVRLSNSQKNTSTHCNTIGMNDMRVIIDSGASNHMFPNREVFYILRERVVVHEQE